MEVLSCRLCKSLGRFDMVNVKGVSETVILKIVASESGTTNSQNLEQDTCYSQWMCYETPLRFNISLREIFLKLGSLRVMKKYDENTLMHNFTSVCDPYHVDCQGVFRISVF